jgi:hypothetical protein
VNSVVKPERIFKAARAAVWRLPLASWHGLDNGTVRDLSLDGILLRKYQDYMN